MVFKAFKLNTASVLTSTKDLVTSSATASYESEESQQAADNGADLLSKNIANQYALNNANIINQAIDITKLKILPETYEEMKYTVKFPHPYSSDITHSPKVTSEDFNGLDITYKRVNLGSKQSKATYPLSDKYNNNDANYGGLVLYGAKDHYFIYDLETSSWLCSENLNLTCDMGILSCDKKILDKYNLIVGTNCVKGQINFGGDGGFNNWRMNVDDSNNLKVSYRRSDGYLIEKTLAYAPLDPENDAVKNSGKDWFTEKRGLPFENKYYNIDTDLNNVTMDLSKTLRYNNMYYKSYNNYSEDSKKLFVSLRLCSEQMIVAGRYMSKGLGYNGFCSGPLIIVRPGDTLEMDIINRDFIYSDFDPSIQNATFQYQKMYHQHVIPYDATYPDHTSYVTHMAHSMVGPTTNNHFHGFEGPPNGLSDNVLRSAKPNSSLLYRYDIPYQHPGGPYWYHPHIHGTSLAGVSRGSAGLIYIEGPYQNYLDSLGIRREIVQVQQINYKNIRDQSEITWVFSNAEFPTDIYNVDACNNAIPPTVFHPTSHYPACANNNDYGPEGSCGCDSTSKTILNGLRDGFNSYPEEVDMSITRQYILNGQMQPVFNIHPNELKMFAFVNTFANEILRLSIDDHYIIPLSKDGHPSVFSSFQTSGLGIDTDLIYRPPGTFLNYIIIGPAERFEMFIIPKQGISTSGKTYNINSLPFDSEDHNEFFANDANKDYFLYTGYAKVSNILIATLSYDQNYIDLNATNSISNFLKNSEIYNPNYTDVIKTNPNQNIKMNEPKDFNLLGYLQERHIKDKTKLVQSFKITDISYVTGYRNYTEEQSFSVLDPIYNVVQITLDTSNKKHFFTIYDGRYDPEGVNTITYDNDTTNNTTVNLKIEINNIEYVVFSVPVETVYDDDGNDISAWVFYIKDTNKSIYNTLINIPDEQKVVSYKYYSIETQSVPILKSVFDNINKHTVTTKYAHRLTKEDVFYFHHSKFIVDEVLSYNSFTFISDKKDPIHGHPDVLFDTYNIKNEYLYLYSKEIYTNNNTYKTTKFYDNNGPTFDINNVDTFSTLEENINNAFYRDPNDPSNKSYFYTKICERRNVTYAFSTSIRGTGEGTAEIDGKRYQDNIVNTMLTNTNCEWLLDSYTNVGHYHHQHVNSFQVCGYKDEYFGFNITPNRFASYVDASNNYIPGDYPYHITYDSTFNYITNTPYDPTIKNPLYQEQEYRFQNEIFVPFEGYSDTIYIPSALGPIVKYFVSAPYGTRGRTRIRFHNNERYLGKLVNHCHLLDHQDQGMMKPLEYVGIDPVTKDCYYPCPDANFLSNDGLRTDFYNNVWTNQHTHSHSHTIDPHPHPGPDPHPHPPTIETTNNHDHSNHTH